ncbi:MAG: peptidase dimerization domain-containing protein [Verrucomicrobiota bacterium]
MEKGYRADLAIVGEPTLGRIVTAHKGDVWLRLDTRGKAALGARPELGRNAVRMAKIVDIIRTVYMLQTHRHPLLGRAVNVGSIQGGTQPNIVPTSSASSRSIATLPGESKPWSVRKSGPVLRAHA